ncbi:MAG: response regulator [Nitrospiraceae bacterium]|nr:response regulator [Nitrospiraceae bacterium]MDA8432162.1 response regulator [Nitrospiraceae bacterium]
MNKKKVLVIDDEDIVRTSCSRTLAPAGFEVRLARNGVEGLKILEEGPFDLVLTDLKMPDMDGIEVLRRIKEGWPAVEVIIITGYQTVDTAVKSIKLGAFDYIEKPFTPDALITAVSKALDRKNA